MLLACGALACSAGARERTRSNDVAATAAGTHAAPGTAGASAGTDAAGTAAAGAAGTGTAGTGAAGTGAAGIGAAPDDVPPAPTGVVFDWPETVPSDSSAPGACKPGRYVGEYACRLYIVASEGDGAFDIFGTIDMQLEQTARGELLRIADGQLLGAAAAAIPMSADIVGELDCARSRFEARLENGWFSVALGLPIPFTDGTFSGPMTASYDKGTFAMNDGAWNMTGQLAGFPGSCMNGTWSAQWVP